MVASHVLYIAGPYLAANILGGRRNLRDVLRHARAHARDVTRRILSISGGPGLALGSQDRDYLESRPLVIRSLVR